MLKQAYDLDFCTVLLRDRKLFLERTLICYILTKQFQHDYLHKASSHYQINVSLDNRQLAID